jgi:hypothetical protein
MSHYDAKHHAKKAMEACDCGDHSSAAHHFGHGLAAIKRAKAGKNPSGSPMTPAPIPKVSGLRNRLKRFKKS